MPQEFLKDPNAKLDYHIDWSDWLGDSDTISDASWSVEADGVTIESESFNDTVATVWLSGGADKTEKKATCHVVTASGREDDRSLTFTLDER